MISVSQEFKDQVSGPHEHVARLDVEQNGVIVRTLNVHAGSVDADRSGRILRRFTALVADPEGELTPEGIRDLLAPFGTIVRPYRGVRIPVVVANKYVEDTMADWTAGTRVGTIANSEGDLVLGNT